MAVIGYLALMGRVDDMPQIFEMMRASVLSDGQPTRTSGVPLEAPSAGRLGANRRSNPFTLLTRFGAIPTGAGRTREGVAHDPRISACSALAGPDGRRRP